MQIFDEWLLKGNLGRRFHPIPAEIAAPFMNQLALFAQRMNLLRETFLPSHKIEIYADFVDDGECNACAGIHDSMGLVAINRGTILLNIEMFNRMFSHPVVLSNIGNSKNERRSGRHSEGMPTNYDDLIDMRRKAGRSLFSPPPLDNDRQGVAQMCIEMAWSFIVMHEITHIVHGHVDYLRATRQMRSILELAADGSVASGNDLDRQAIELWADNRAASVVFRGLMKKTTGPFVNRLFPLPAGKLFIWAFAVFSLFRLWGLKFELMSLQHPTHPPTLLRFEMVLLYAQIEFCQEFPELSDMFWTVVTDARIEADSAFAYCGSPRLQPSDISDMRHPAAVAHIDILTAHMTEVLGPKLRRYSYTRLDNPPSPQSAVQLKP